MRPESTSVTLRRDLSEVAQEYDEKKAAGKFISERACPLIEVAEASATYPIMNRENFKKVDSTLRAADGGYNRIEGTFGSGTFSCDENGLEYRIDDRRRKRFATFLDAEQSATRILRYRMHMARERRVQALWAALGLTNHNVATAWSDSANAKPIDDILTGIETLEDNCGCGREDLTLIIPRADFREALATTQVANKSLYTYPGIQPAMLSAVQFAAMLDIKQILLARSSYDSTEEGVAESNAQVWTAGVMYLAELADAGDDLEVPSAVRMFLWTADSPDLPVIETYRDDSVRSDIVRMREDTDEAATAEANLMAYQITNT